MSLGWPTVVVVGAVLLEAGPGWGGEAVPAAAESWQWQEGAVIRGCRDRRELALVFTAHEYGEGAGLILDALRQRGQKAAFFLTGVFVRVPGFRPVIERMLAEGHDVGPHSDQHLLYCPWTGPKQTLVTREEFDRDLDANLASLEAAGVRRSEIRFLLPPFEWSNEEIAAWSRARGWTLVNFTPGTRVNADYTTNGAPNYVSSQAILESVWRRAEEKPAGLNGAILLMHLGSGPGRADKLADRIGELLDGLAARHYQVIRLAEMFPTNALAAVLKTPGPKGP